MKQKVIGVDLGGTNIRAAIVDSKGEILGDCKYPTLAERPYEEIRKDITRAIRMATKETDIDAIGVGSPGPLDSASGVILTPPNLRTMHGKPLAADLADIFGIPAVLANDAHCAGLGECWLGAARGYKRAAGVTLGTGFGGWTNFGLVPEFGHMISLNGQGALCHCGQRGCPEAYISSYGILRIASQYKYDRLVLREVSDLGSLLEKENLAALRLVRNVGGYLGRVFVNIAHICEPDVIVVGGSIAKLGAPLLNTAKAEMLMRGFKHRVENVKILPAELGDNSGVIGAAKLAFNFLENGGSK